MKTFEELVASGLTNEQAVAALAAQNKVAPVVHLKGSLLQSSYSLIQDMVKGETLSGECSGKGFQKGTDVKDYYTLHIEVKPANKPPMILKVGQNVWDFVKASGFEALKGKILTGTIGQIDGNTNVYFDSSTAILE